MLAPCATRGMLTTRGGSSPLRWVWRAIAIWVGAMALMIGAAHAQSGQAQAAPPDKTSAGNNRVSCESQPGGREHCPADTSAGVVLAKSSGSAPCLLGKTWGYDDTGIWVSDGCSGEVTAGPGGRGTNTRETTGETPQPIGPT